MATFPLTTEQVLEIIEDSDKLDQHFDALYEYYLTLGPYDGMPYGTAKARDGDPDQWIYDRLCQDFGERVVN